MSANDIYKIFGLMKINLDLDEIYKLIESIDNFDYKNGV